MANQWFRLYSDILHNAKIQILPESLRWRYVSLLCLQCENNYENTPDDEIALSLRVTVEEWAVTKKELINRRLLSEKGKIIGWEKRQYISDLKDPTAAERQKRYRENKRNDRNDTVTSRLPEQIQNITDTDIGKEKNNKKENPKKILFEFGIEGQLADDFMQHRASKKSPITKTALNGFSREAEKAKISIHDAIKCAIERGWTGFRADWYTDQNQKQESNHERNARECRDAIYSTDF